jgi:hypothetical protein
MMFLLVISQQSVHLFDCRALHVQLMQQNSLRNALFLDATLCDSCKNQRFGGTYCLHHQGDKNQLMLFLASQFLSP